MRLKYADAPEYTADAYRVQGWGGVAWYVRGWELEPRETTWEDEDGNVYEDVEDTRTGWLVMTMVGDDRHFAIDPEDVEPLNADEYCSCCGQIGCHWD